jgi:transposase
MALRLRPLTAEAGDLIQRRAHSRTAPARLVERARIVWPAPQGLPVPAMAQTLRPCQATVRAWLKRVNRQGLAGVQEAPPPGRPATSPPAPVSQVIATSLTPPRALGLPFASWTLERLAADLQEGKGRPIKGSRLDERLLRAGGRWRTQETWRGARGDPACADTRGASRRSPPRRRRAVSSWAWMSWAPKAPSAFRDESWWANSLPPPRWSLASQPALLGGPPKRLTLGAVARAIASAPSGRPTARR